MKKHKINILFRLFSLISLFGLLSCSDDDKSDLDFSKEVSITSFKANNIEGVINKAKKPFTIDVYLPWSADLKDLSLQYTLSEGATIDNTNTEHVDLSTPITYRIFNGNLYNDYTVSAAYSKFTSFGISTYSGVIDDSAKTITIKYPKNIGVEKLRVEYTVTPGATVTPESGVVKDFTSPQIYTISYLGESVYYTVTVVPTNFEPVAFLGTAANESLIADADEKAAFAWFKKNVPNAEYVSFSTIKNDDDALSKFSVLWWHLDSSQNLPSMATSTKVVEAISSYYNNGGSLFLSSFAVKYAATIGVTLDGKEANNIWGDGNGEEASTVGEDWGLSFTGHEDHPAFSGLNKPAGVSNKVYLLSSGLKVKAHNAIWNFAESWVDYKSKDIWQEANGGIGLASFQWDNSNEERAVMFEYPKTGTKGGVICIGSEAYDWYVVGTNEYQNNLQNLTSNIIQYLQ